MKNAHRKMLFSAKAIPFLIIAIFFFVAVVVFAQVVPSTSDIDLVLPEKPNVLLVIGDDLTLEQMAYMPLTVDFFRREGIIFRRGYTPTPLCCPERATLLTGRYSHTHGIKFNENRAQWGYGGAIDFTSLGLDRSTIATWLDDAGYRTGLIGKYLNLYNQVLPSGYVPPGWDVWNAVFDNFYFNHSLSENGTVVSYGSAESDYQTDVLREKALTFLDDTAKSGDPFFLYFAPATPHEPGTPAPRHQALYPEGLHAPRKPNFNTSIFQRRDKPRWIRQRGQISLELMNYYDRLWTDEARSLAAFDEAFMALVGKLERDGRLNNTAIIFISDNGYGWLAHTIREKRVPYEEAIHIPFMVKPPKFDNPHPENKSLVSQIDIPPTILGWAGVLTPTHLSGKSLISLFDNPGLDIHDAVFSEGWAYPNEDCMAPYFSCGEPTFSLVVSQRGFKYIELLNGEKELYDLKNDPHEMDNIIDKPQHAPIIAHLKEILDRMKRE